MGNVISFKKTRIDDNLEDCLVVLWAKCEKNTRMLFIKHGIGEKAADEFLTHFKPIHDKFFISFPVPVFDTENDLLRDIDKAIGELLKSASRHCAMLCAERYERELEIYLDNYFQPMD